MDIYHVKFHLLKRENYSCMKKKSTWHYRFTNKFILKEKQKRKKLIKKKKNVYNYKQTLLLLFIILEHGKLFEFLAFKGWNGIIKYEKKKESPN